MDQSAMYVRQIPIEPIVVPGKTAEIEAKKVEYRGVELPHIGHSLDTSSTEFVCRPIRHAAFHPAPIIQTVKASGLWSRPVVFAWCVGIRPNSVVQRTNVSFNTLVVSDPSITLRLVGRKQDNAARSRFQSSMRIPVQQPIHSASAGCTIQIDVSNISFEQSSCKQAIPSIRRNQFALMIRTIQPMRLFGFHTQIGYFGADTCIFAAS